MKRLFVLCCFSLWAGLSSANIPLSEHPRPDFERSQWENLNGAWHFTFDEAKAQAAIASGAISSFDLQITVPFPWGSKLSGVADKGDKAWYAREITIPAEWKGKRIFVVVGASDWETRAWLDGKEIGVHQGGYTPFSFEITDKATFGVPQKLIIGADDTGTNQHLGGKQGYGNARGIWQTVYLEARGTNFIDYVHFSPNIDKSEVAVEVALNAPLTSKSALVVIFSNGERADFTYKPARKSLKSLKHTFTIPLTQQHLWTLDDPYLYEATVTLNQENKPVDKVNTYWGQRKIGVTTLPGLGFPYVALNNKPIYLKLCLDQSYHPDGFYTFPSDDFMRDEILLSKKMGLNGNRIHIKAEIPRKLYWADRLGLLIMADIPNFWGEPKDEARKDWEFCLREQVKRDYNHPSIFAWVDFNETWGLFTQEGDKRLYLPATQQWVSDMYHLTKALDPTRLVEDNSPCNNDHIASTDLNSWHGYHPGYDWEKVITRYDTATYPGSGYNFVKGAAQRHQPMFNSECGNVWGYHNGSAGNSDYTWDYHIMMNSFRAHPKICGWLYTEHHDVINEWNGYVLYDRSPKIDGLADLVPGMTIADFHSLYYISPRIELCSDVKGGSSVSVPLVASFMTDENPGELTLKTRLIGWNILGERTEGLASYQKVPFAAWMNKAIAPVQLKIPAEKGLYLLQMLLCDASGSELHHNFVIFRVKEGSEPSLPKVQTVTFAPASFKKQQWSIKQANVLDGLKVNGFGSGYFDYEIPWPTGCRLADLSEATLRFEASAKQFFGKDNDGSQPISGDFMAGGGTHDPCKSPNAYAMTDLTTYDSWVQVFVNDVPVGMYYLPDDPADHRGILSWHAQPHNYTLHEAGSYGYLINARLPITALQEGKPIRIRLATPGDLSKGLAIYGKDFGRYPLDPSLILVKR